MGKALEKNPDKRYQPIDELLDDLKSISDGIEPEGIRARLRKAKLLKRKRAIRYAGVASLLILVAWAHSFFLPDASKPWILSLSCRSRTSRVTRGRNILPTGLTDELIGQLAQIGALRVISRTSVMKYKGREETAPRDRPRAQGGCCGGGDVASGRRQRAHAGGIDRSSPRGAEPLGTDLRWSMSDVLLMYSEMARAIAGKMQSQARPSGRDAPGQRPPGQSRGLRGLSQRPVSLVQTDSTGPRERAAILRVSPGKRPELRPGLCGNRHVWVGRQQQGFVPASETTPKAKAAAEKALELDSTLAEVHYTLAGIRAWADWDWEGAETEYRRAIELNPNYPDPRAYYSHLLYIMKRPEEAMAQIKRALELDPLNALLRAIYAMDLMYARRYDDAIALLRDTLRTSPNDLVAISTLRSAFHMKGMHKEALEVWKASYAARGDREAEEALTRGFAEGGYRGALRRVAETLVARSRTTYVPSWQIGTLYTRAGKKDEALEWLEKAYEAHDQNMPYISVDPIFDILRDDPRFQDLLRRMRLQ